MNGLGKRGCELSLKPKVWIPGRRRGLELWSLCGRRQGRWWDSCRLATTLIDRFDICCIGEDNGRAPDKMLLRGSWRGDESAASDPVAIPLTGYPCGEENSRGANPVPPLPENSGIGGGLGCPVKWPNLGDTGGTCESCVRFVAPRM